MVQKNINKKQETYGELKNRLKKSVTNVKDINKNIEKTKQLVKDRIEDIEDIKKNNIGCELCANLLAITYDQKELIEDVLSELKNQKTYIIIKQDPKKLEILNKNLKERTEKLLKRSKQYNNIIDRLIKTEDVIYSKAIAEVLLEVLNKSKKDLLNPIDIRR